MTQRLRVGTCEALSAAATGGRFARDFFIGGQQGAAMVFVPRLSTPLTTGGFPWGATLDGRPIAGRGLGRILRVLAEAGGKIGDLLPQSGDITLKIADEG